MHTHAMAYASLPTRRTLSSFHPWLYQAALWRQRGFRSLKEKFSDKRFATHRVGASLPFRITKHQSLLIRKLGDSDMTLQYNKVKNLKLASKEIDGVMIRPGETFSVWKLVGHPTKKKGYVDGLLLSHGEAKVGIGGGLCQIANLIYWMALHSPLVVTERYRHSFDAFPDSGRTIPFGTGATLFYNHIDLQLYNPTNQTIQLRIWVTDEHLKGELRSEEAVEHSHSVIERDHKFLTDGRKYFRANKIFREVRERETGKVLNEELVCDNFCEMKYQPPIEATIETISRP